MSKRSTRLYGKIRIEHVEKACDWAQRQIDRGTGNATKIDGTKREFHMGTWDCGTACCLAGGAALEAGYSQRWTSEPEPAWAWDGETIAGCRASELHTELQRGTDAERDLAYVFGNNYPSNAAPRLALEACAAIRKERGLPPRKAKGRK